MGWELYGIVALVAVIVVVGIGIGVWRGRDIRINVLLLALVVTAIVAMGFGYASGTDGMTRETIAQLTDALASDAATATVRVNALLQLLDIERAFARDLLTVVSVAGGAVTLIGTIMGYLLRAGNDLTKPFLRALDMLDQHGDDERIEDLRKAVDAVKAELGKSGGGS